MRLRQLVKAGVPTSTLVAPVIPAINDAEIERILEAVAETGVRNAGYVLLRLPLEMRDLFREWLTENFPDRVEHVFKLVRDTRGGKDYDSTWGKRMTGSGPIAWMIGRRFEVACERLGFNTTKRKITTEHFRPPRPAGAAARICSEEPSNLPAIPAVVPARCGSHAAAIVIMRPHELRTSDIIASRKEPRNKAPRVCRSARRSSRPTFRRERTALKRGVWPVAGCDEAGRGPLAGPVVAAAVILDPDDVPRGLDDSKRLTAERREVLYERICARAQVAVAMAPPCADRSRQYFARLAVGAGARGRGAAGQAAPGLRRRPRPHRCRLRLPGGDRRRRSGRLDRGRLDRRQGDARPADGLPGRRPSRLRLRAPHGL